MSATIAVDFNRKIRPKLVHIEGGVYQYSGKDAFYERPVVEGKQTVRKLASTTLSKAKLEVARKRSEQGRAKIGLAIDPYSHVQGKQTIEQLAKFYTDSGYPKRNEAARIGKQVTEEKRRVENIVEYFGQKPWDQINLEDCRGYHAVRIKQIQEIRKGQPGDRTVDMELVTLSAIFRWAVRNGRRTGVTSNPVAHERMRFQRSASVRHCRDVMPASPEELHSLARSLFDNPQSEVLGWQLLFEAMIGQRTHEILYLRRDAQNDTQPGFIKSGNLFLYRSESAKGTFPYIRIHAALRDCLAAHQKWIESRYPDCTTFFPSPFDPKKPVSNGALTKALDRICPGMSLPHRTSHGLRSYYVNVLRSDGMSDGEIALRIGQKSGGKLIVSTYGEILPYKLHWMPKESEPAWTIFNPAGNQRPVQMDLGI